MERADPSLWPAQMRALAELNLECSFDFTYFDSKDEEAW